VNPRPVKQPSNRGGHVIKARLFCTVVLTALLAVAIGIVSCGGQATTSSGSPNAGASPAASAGTNGSAAAIHLVLTGGTGAGTFDLKAADPCTFTKQPTTTLWGATYGDGSTPPILAFTLAVDIKVSPAAFTLGALTQSLSGQSYNISTVAGVGIGSGTADVQDLGATAKISINGKTNEGYGVTATVQCNQIQRI
jgi:hypothetical protein